MVTSFILNRILHECTVPGFFAGIVGNLVASRIDWAILRGASEVKRAVMDSVASGLKNHDLARALVRAQMVAATEVIDITLLEDHGAAQGPWSNFVESLSCLLPLKAFSDLSNADINALWTLRTSLESRIGELETLESEELEKSLVVALSKAPDLAAPETRDAMGMLYQDWSIAAATILVDALREMSPSVVLPASLNARIVGGQWMSLFREAFRDELKRNKPAETAYFINVHGSLLAYAHQHIRDIDGLRSALKEGHEVQATRMSEMRRLLMDLRGAARDLQTSSRAERERAIAGLRVQELEWRKLAGEFKETAVGASAHLLKGQKKSHKQIVAILNKTENIGKDLKRIEKKLEVAIRSPRYDALTTSIVRHLAKEFWGRDWLFAKIAEFRERNHETGGYVVITGLPGQGKSAIAAKLSEESRALLHFFRKGTVFSELSSFQTHFLEQAAELFGTECHGKNADVGHTEILESLCWEISGQMRFPTDCLLIVDALDEASPEALKAGVNPLGLPPKLGRGIFFVITSRDRDDCKLVDSGATPVLCIELHRSVHNNFDAIEFIQSHLSNPNVERYLTMNGVAAAEFAEALLAKSEGNFMYLRHVLPELAGGIFVGTALEHLPRGLREYYAMHWRAMVDEADGADLGWKMAVLAVLASLQEQCSATELWEIVQHIPGVLREQHVALTIQEKVYRSTIADVRKLFSEWQEFLLTDARSQEPESRIYHLEFSDFLRKDALRGSIDFVRVTAAAFFYWQTSKRKSDTQ